MLPFASSFGFDAVLGISLPFSATVRYTAGTFSFPQACSQSILALPTPGIHSRTGTRKRSNPFVPILRLAGRGIGYCPTSASLTGHTIQTLS